MDLERIKKNISIFKEKRDPSLPDELNNLEAVECSFVLYKMKQFAEDTIAVIFPLDLENSEIKNWEPTGLKFDKSKVSRASTFDLLRKIKAKTLPECWTVHKPNSWLRDSIKENEGIFMSHQIDELNYKYRKQGLKKTLEASLMFYQNANELQKYEMKHDNQETTFENTAHYKKFLRFLAEAIEKYSAFKEKMGKAVLIKDI